MRIISFSKGIIIAASTAFLMACGGGGTADKLMGYQEKMMSIIESNKGDLDKAATELKAYVEANKADFQAAMKSMMEEMKGKSAEEATAIQAKYAEKAAEMEKRGEQLEKDIPGLKDHAGIKEAMGGLMAGM
jgi:hypothetical protein